MQTSHLMYLRNYSLINRFRFLFTLYLFSLTSQSLGQNFKRSAEVTLSPSLIAFSANKNDLKGNVLGAEVAYRFRTNNNSPAWMRELNIKSLDIYANYKRMREINRIANPSRGEFGDSYALLGGLTIPILKIKGVELQFSSAAGFVYVGESWFSNQNPIIGSKLNFGLKSNLNFEIPLVSNSSMLMGLDIFHYSNGGTQVPNNGINVSSVSVGFKQYFLETAVTANSKPVQRQLQQRHSFDFGGLIGRRGAYESKKGHYRAALYGGYNYQFTKYFSLGSGVDAVYNATVLERTRFEETYQSKASSYNNWRLGLAIGPDLRLGKAAVTAKYGYYLYYDSYFPVKTYWTAGAKYKLNNWLALQTKIYLHQTEADFVGFGFLLIK